MSEGNDKKKTRKDENTCPQNKHKKRRMNSMIEPLQIQMLWKEKADTAPRLFPVMQVQMQLKSLLQ